MTMREGWANAYVTDYGPACGKFVDLGAAVSRELADHWATFGRRPSYRVHVKLKPEGAPKRYANEDNREAWETDAKACRKTMRTFGISPTSIRL
jgi:hypothetical protein